MGNKQSFLLCVVSFFIFRGSFSSRSNLPAYVQVQLAVFAATPGEPAFLPSIRLAFLGLLLVFLIALFQDGEKLLVVGGLTQSPHNGSTEEQ